MGDYRSVIREAAAKSAVADGEATDTTTEHEGNQDQSKEPGSAIRRPAAPAEKPAAKAEPYHPLLADLDLSDLDEAAKAKLLDKVKAYDKQFHRENSSFQAYKKFQQQYQHNPAFQKDVDKAVSRHFGGGSSEEPEETASERKPSETPSAATKRLDLLLSKAASAEERESLREARQIIVEETAEHRESLAKLTKKLDAMERDVQGFRTERQSSRLDGFAKELDALETKFSSSLIEKHRETLQKWAIQYPSKSAEWLLYKVAEPDELEASRLPTKAKASSNGKGPSTTRRPAAEVTPPASDALTDDRFKTGTGKARKWDLGQAFRHLATQKSRS